MTNNIRTFRGGQAILCGNGLYYDFPDGLIEEVHRAFDPDTPVPQGDTSNSPIPGVVQIVDPTEHDMSGYRRKPWVIFWPHVAPKSDIMVVLALMQQEGITARIGFRSIGRGLYHIHRGQREPVVKRAKTGKISKYNWQDLEVDVPVIKEAPSLMAVHSLFSGWCRKRGLLWRITAENLGNGQIRVTRIK